jgi:hypothetical protein
MIFIDHKKGYAWYTYWVLYREDEKVIILLIFSADRIVWINISFLFHDFSDIFKILFGIVFGHYLIDEYI